jgi:hypothetical protein
VSEAQPDGSSIATPNATVGIGAAGVVRDSKPNNRVETRACAA